MGADQREVVKALQEDFGFDEFMANQIFQCLKKRGLIVTEPLGDSISTVLRVMEDYGLEHREVLDAVGEMQSEGVVFRER